MSLKLASFADLPYVKTLRNAGCETRIIYKSAKLQSLFSVKDKTKFKPGHDVVYGVTCLKNSCNATYIGETERRISVRAKEHAKCETSHLARYSGAVLHDSATVDNLNVIAHNFSSNTHRKEILEALIVKNLKPSLNVQECSVLLKLF